jgi:hypothetical protein
MLEQVEDCAVREPGPGAGAERSFGLPLPGVDLHARVGGLRNERSPNAIL